MKDLERLEKFWDIEREFNQFHEKFEWWNGAEFGTLIGMIVALFTKTGYWWLFSAWLVETIFAWRYMKKCKKVLAKMEAFNRNVFDDKDKKMARKWNWKTHKYDEYELPKKAMMYTDNMDEVCQCASCGKDMVFGDGYTSMEIHTDLGLGYIVCEECYEKEWNRRKDYK